MSESPLSADALQRLRNALQSASHLSHAEVEQLLPELIDAERAGEDVDANPRFLPVLQHLDECKQCLDLYAELTAIDEELFGEQEPAAVVVPAAPRFFSKPILKGDDVLLTVLPGRTRRFSLAFAPPRLSPRVATLSGQDKILYADTVPEVTGAPILALTVRDESSSYTIQIAVRDQGTPRPWKIQLQYVDQTLTVTTNAQGVARFALPPDVERSSITLLCEELPSAANE